MLTSGKWGVGCTISRLEQLDALGTLLPGSPSVPAPRSELLSPHSPAQRCRGVQTSQ